jgi:hypothetical protein
MADINVTEEIIDINVTEEVVNIIAPSGGYPLPNTINSVFGRVGNIIATEGDYTLTQLGDVTLTSPSNGQVLKYNGTQWVNSTDADTGITTLNTLTALIQTFATGSSGTDFNISSATSTHTFNLPTASATNRGLLSSSDWTTFNAKQNALTNPVTGTGTTNTLPKFTGASTIGNSNITDTGSLITLASNVNLNGNIAIGVTPLAGYNLYIFKSLTGATTTYGIAQTSSVLSDVTNSANANLTQLNTQAASFTLVNYNHYVAGQGSIGAGSVVTNQNAFLVGSSLIGATNNYGFRGQIPSGTNRWNLYMDGTAANYLAGDTGIGTQTLGTATQLTIGGTETAVSAISRGQLINTTLVASANNDVLVGLDINPTYTLGAFTGTQSLGIRSTALITTNLAGGFYGGFVANSNRLGNNNYSFSSHSPSSGVANQIYSGSRPATPTTNAVTHYVGTDTQVYWDTTNAPYNFLISGTQYLKLFNTTGNFTLQNGGTFTDAGFRLDVNGTTRFIGTATSDTAPLGAELAAVTGTGTNWTLAGTNLNVGGYTHTVGSVDPLTTALAAVNGTYYQIAYTITGRTTGSITINYGGTSASGITATGNTGPLASSTAVLTITPTTDFNGTVVLSIKTISTSTASSTFSTSGGTANIEIRANSGINNTFIGLQSGRRNTTGGSNTFIGIISGRDNTTGNDNTYLGSGVGIVNTTSNANTFIGSNTGASNISIGFNTFLGNNAGLSNTLGNSNTFLGRSAGQNITTGFQNVMIGNDAGRFITGGSTSNTTSFSSIFIGVSTRAAADSQGNQIVIGNGTTGLGSNTTIIGTTATTTTALYGNIRLVSGMGTAPASATATGTTGDIVVTAGFIYVCTATNTWVRTALTTW